MTISNIRASRLDLLRAARDLANSGMSRGTAGNLSTRTLDGFLITPTGIQVQHLTPAAMVPMDLNGKAFGDHKPSSEWRFHMDIYINRSDVGAVVHVHSPFCTALACQMMDIPAFHYMIAVAGGKDIRCSDYATFGSQELSDAALRALEGRKACLLGHHGMLATGENLEGALKLAHEVEELAEQFWRVLQIGQPKLISDEEMDRVLEKFKNYGQPQKTS